MSHVRCGECIYKPVRINPKQETPVSLLGKVGWLVGSFGSIDRSARNPNVPTVHFGATARARQRVAVPRRALPAPPLPSTARGGEEGRGTSAPGACSLAD